MNWSLDRIRISAEAINRLNVALASIKAKLSMEAQVGETVQSNGLWRGRDSRLGNAAERLRQGLKYRPPRSVCFPRSSRAFHRLDPQTELPRKVG